MKNFKKIVALVLALSLVLSMGSVSFAATTNEAQAKVLYDLGLFKGYSATEMVLGLEDETTAAQAITLIGRALGWAVNLDAAQVYSDVPAYAAPYVAFAVEAKITNGIGDGMFGAEVDGQRVVTWTLRALGYDMEKAWTETTTLAATAGLTLPAVPVTRGSVAGSIYETLMATPVGGTMTVIETLVAATPSMKDVAVAAGLIVDVPTATVSATGAKSLTVTFNKVVDDTKAVITVKKASVVVNTDKVVFATDKKSAVVTTTTNLTKGDYTVSVAGLTETAFTAVTTVEDVKVAEIKIVSPTAPRLAANDKKAVVNYEVLNQYGEKMTGQTVSWTISTGVAVSNESTINGTFEITAAGGADFVPGAVVYITGVHAASATVVNAQVAIGLAAKADAVTFKGVYDMTDGKLADLPAGFANGRYVLLLEVKDQYSNKISSPTLSQLVFTSNNPLFVAGTFAQGADVTVDDVVYTAVELDPGTNVDNGGTVTVQAISTITGKTSPFTLTAEAVAAVKSFTMSAPATIIAEDETVAIPFTALDQNGNAVVKYSALNGKITLASGLAFVQNNDGTAKLNYTAPATGATSTTDLPVYLTSVVTAGGNFSSLMVSVKDLAVPTAIVGLDSAKSTYVAKGNSVVLKAEDFVVQDQYGRTITDANVNTWVNGGGAITVESTVGGTTPFTSILNAGADAATYDLTLSTDTATLAAGTATAATEVITVSLTGVAASAKTFTFTKVLQSSYTSYSVDDLGLMHNDGVVASADDAKYNKTVKVYGVMANGTKVALPAADFSVSAPSKLTVTGAVISDNAAAGYVTATDFTATNGDSKNVTTTVLVTVNDSDTGAALAIVEKELVITDADSKLATVTLISDVKDGMATMNPLVAAIRTVDFTDFIDEQKDQFGVAFTEAPVITITALTKVDGSAFTVSGNGTNAATVATVSLGDKFTATYKYGSGVTAVIKFTVGTPQ